MQNIVDHFSSSSYSTNNQELLKLVKPIGGRLLDLGCNNGELTVKLAEKAKASEIFGIEINPVAITKAKKRNIKVYESDLNSKLPFKNNYFKTITANQVIEHLCFTDDFIEEVRRIMKLNGQLIISTTNLAAIHYRIQLLLGQMPICLHPAERQYGNFLRGNSNPRYGHKSVFTHRAFVEFLNSHNFIVEKAKTVQIYPFSEKVSRLLLKIFPNFGVFSTVSATRKS